MKNTERQKSLDKQKWLMSEECGQDLSGEMIYCEFCSARQSNKCNVAQKEREKWLLCARAYNRMKRR